MLPTASGGPERNGTERNGVQISGGEGRQAVEGE